MAFYVAVLTQSIPKRRDRLCKWRGSSAVQKTDHRHRSLLRARREWPCGRRASKECHELTPFRVEHGIPLRSGSPAERPGQAAD
jgi:hypothetical protein